MLNSGQIRLLHIQPGKGSDISCNISIAPLASSPPYDALSYTWGNQELSHEISVAGQSSRVTSNLYSALTYLRREDEELTIWIDAICIDQHNDAERSAQVGIMADIYHRARQVIMWVGEEAEFDEIAFSLLQQVKDVFSQHGRVDFDFQMGPDGMANPGYGLPDTASTKWIALSRLFLRPYFGRIWVIQEVVRATRAFVVCGRLKIEWEVVRDFARSLQKGGSLGDLEYEETAPGIVAVNVMADLKAGSGIDLLSLLVKTRAYQATLPVDKVFALMNLASNPQNVGVKVNYSMKAPEVWERIATHSLVVQRSLLCLSNAGMCSSLTQSWVPDWGSTYEYRGCLALHGKDHFKASGETKVALNVSDDLQTLRIRGFIVDTIAVVAPNILEFTPRTRTSGPLIWMTPEEAEGRNSRIIGELKATAAVATHAFLYSDGEARHRQIARTLCCDILTTGEAAGIDGAYKVWQYHLRMVNLVPLAPGADVAAILRELERAKPDDIMMEQFMHPWFLFGVGRSICTTVRGDLGRVPFGTAAGDLVCVLKGGVVPYLLRKHEGCYKLIGECFVNGIMYGEALEMEGLVEQEFEIK